MVLPLSVLVVTKNETDRIGKCIDDLQGRFGQVIVIDSESEDGTAELAARAGAEVVPYHWNGRYPKKRQWCLENLPLKYDWVFFLDADEEITPDFLEELSRIDWETAFEAGFFVKAAYVWKGRVLRHGLRNNKLCILHRARLAFPEVDDLDIPGMGEIEGHYQPVRKPGFEDAPLGQIRAPILHHALENKSDWQTRHERYARWEAGMDKKDTWPQDPVLTRRWLKTLFKVLPCRGEIAFLHSFVLKGGFWDGWAGYALARSRRDYYRAISRLKAR